MKIYQYPKCSTCRKALKFLDQKGVRYSSVDITEKPPTKKELKQMLQHYDGDLRRLFNTSGQLYREFKIKDKLADMTTTDAVNLLAQHGKLIKRPFVVHSRFGLVGFKEEEWRKSF